MQLDKLHFGSAQRPFGLLSSSAAGSDISGLHYDTESNEVALIGQEPWDRTRAPCAAPTRIGTEKMDPPASVRWSLAFFNREGETALTKIKNLAENHEARIAKQVGPKRRMQLMGLLWDFG